MIDSQTKLVLKTMQKSTGDMGRGVFTTEYIEQLTKIDEDDVLACLNFLEKEGYVEWAYYEPSHIACGAYLTQPGKKYPEFERGKIRALWGNAFVNAIVGAVVGSAITLAIEYVLGPLFPR